MSSRPSPLASKTATPPGVISGVMYVPSGYRPAEFLMPTSLVTSRNRESAASPGADGAPEMASVSRGAAGAVARADVGPGEDAAAACGAFGSLSAAFSQP